MEHSTSLRGVRPLAPQLGARQVSDLPRIAYFLGLRPAFDGSKTVNWNGSLRQVRDLPRTGRPSRSSTGRVLYNIARP